MKENIERNLMSFFAMYDFPLAGSPTITNNTLDPRVRGPCLGATYVPSVPSPLATGVLVGVLIKGGAKILPSETARTSVNFPPNNFSDLCAPKTQGMC